MAKETVHSDGALVEKVQDLVARWPQLEEMRRAGGTGADGSRPCP